MRKLILRELNERDERAFIKGCEDWGSDDLDWYTFVWQPGMPHGEHIQKLRDQKDKSKIPTHWVPSTMLYGFVDGEIVGRLSIRHELNSHLTERGGHVGYAVSPPYRRNGYASEMLRQGLEYCKTLNLSKILITCADDNVQSWRVIEKLGGQLENKLPDAARNELVRRYWITLAQPDCAPLWHLKTWPYRPT